jgi:outer membrane receptor protein involved in Fe transport
VPKFADQVEVAVQGTNLTDEVYYVYHATLAPTGQEIGLAAQPRLIYAVVRYSF